MPSRSIMRRRQVSARCSLVQVLKTACAGICLAGATTASAETATWVKPVGGEWLDGANWSSNPSYPDGLGDVAILGNAISADATVFIGQAITLGGLTLDGGHTYTLSPSTQAGELIFNDPGGAYIGFEQGAATHSILTPITLASDLSANNNAGSVLTLGGRIFGNGAIRKIGQGTLSLGGNNATWNGGLEVQAGTVQLDHVPAASGNYTGLGTGYVSIQRGAMLSLQNATNQYNVQRITNSMGIAGDGIDGRGAIMLDTGKSAILTGKISINGGASIGAFNGSTIHIGDPSTRVGHVSGDGGLVKVGAGGSVQLNVRSVHTGGTHVREGTLLVSPSGSLVGGGGGVRVDTPGRLLLGSPAGNDPALHSVTPNSVSLRGGLVSIPTNADPSTVLAADSTGGVLAFHLNDDRTLGGTNTLDFNALPAGHALRLGGTYESTSLAPTVTIMPHASHNTYRLGGAGGTLTITSSLGDANGREAHVEHDVDGTTFIKGANTYGGVTIVRGGILAADHKDALGKGTGIDADGTTVFEGGTLSIQSGATIASELITLRGGSLAGGGTVNGSVVLAADSTIGGARVGGVVSGSGNLTLSGPGSGTLEGANTYTGHTRVTGGSFEVRHAQGLGASSAGTEVIGGELHLYANTQEQIIGKGGTISLRTPTYDGPIVLSGGTLAAIGSNTTAALNGRLELRGGRSTIATSNGGTLSVAGGTTGDGHLVLNGERLSVDAPLAHTGRTIARTGAITINVPVNLAGGLVMDGPVGTLEFKENSTTASLELNGGNLWVKAGKTLAIGGDELTLRAGSIQGNLSGPSIIRKVGAGTVALDLIGDDYDPEITVERGTLSASPWGLGSANKPTIVESTDAVLQLGPGTHNEPIVLKNASGVSFAGGLRGSQNARLDGALDLGNVGSYVGGDITLGGAIGGSGAIHVVGDVRIAGEANTYTGPTVIHGTLSLRERGRIVTSYEIVVRPRASLVLDNLEGGNETDRLADGIPITLHGGTLALRGDSIVDTTTSETVGPVRIVDGDATVRTTHPYAANTVRLTLASVQRTGTGTVRFIGGSGALGAGQQYDPSILITAAPSLTNGIIGGWATVPDRYGHGDFATYDAVHGVQKLSGSGRPQQVKAASSADNVRFTGDGAMDSLTADTQVHSLVVDPESLQPGRAVAFDLGGRRLNIASGGLLKAGPSTLTISNGQLTAGGDAPGELFLTSAESGKVHVAADITDNPGGKIGLTQSGGWVLLSGTNTYSGPTVLNGGTLDLAAVTALPAGTDVVINDGSVRHELPGGTFLDVGAFTMRGSGFIEAVNADRYDVESGGLRRLNGNGPLSKISRGQLSLKDNVAYAGDITVHAGTLVVQSADALGSGLTTIKDGAVVRFDHSSFAYAGRIRLEGGEFSGTLGSTNLAATPPIFAIADTGARTLAAGGTTLTFTGDLEVHGASRLRVADAPPSANAAPNQVRLTGATSLDVDARLLVDGPGIVSFAGPLSAGPGGKLRVRESTVKVGNVSSAETLSVTITDGGAVSFASAPKLAKLIVDGAATVVVPGQGQPVVLGELTIQSGGTFDLADNSLIVRANAATRQAILASVAEALRTARNSADVRWTGPGLTSSAAAGLPHATLAIGFLGDDIIVKFTHNGDANLDGRVNADDYFRIDSGFLAQPEDPTYAQGDFNYDGRINADDYFLIDSAFLGQSGSLGASVGAVAAVPEPGTTTGFLLAASLLRRWRRR